MTRDYTVTDHGRTIEFDFNLDKGETGADFVNLEVDDSNLLNIWTSYRDGEYNISQDVDITFTREQMIRIRDLINKALEDGND